MKGIGKILANFSIKCGCFVCFVAQRPYLDGSSCQLVHDTTTKHVFYNWIFKISTSEKFRNSLPWKTTSRFRQAVKYGHNHVGQDVPIGRVPNGSEV